MPESPENKITNTIVKAIDSIDLDLPWLAYVFCTQNGTAVQRRMFDLCLAFLRHWSSRYERGEIKNTQILYPYCAKAYAMVRAHDLDTTERVDAARLLT